MRYKIIVPVLLLGIYTGALAQNVQVSTLPPTILEIDFDNHVNYVEDTFDVSRFATSPNIVPATLQPTFTSLIGIADVVAVNGKPAKGNWIIVYRSLNLTTASTSGLAIADTIRGNFISHVFEIQNADGTPIGSIMAQGLGGAGTPPPGSPAALTQGNLTIIGGTGAFAGVRGTAGQGVIPNTIRSRAASMVEDPSFRRKNGGGRGRQVLSINPAATPLPTVTGLTVSPPTVKPGGSYTTTVVGSNVTDKTYFDVLFRAPGSTVDVEAFNWQQGPVATHAVAADTPLGVWTISGIRFHENANDHFTGAYVPLSVQISVAQ
jgi:hypothetical protein